MCPLIRTSAVVTALAVLIAAGCRQAAPPTAIPDVVVVTAASLPGDPADAAWKKAPEHVAKLILQDLVEPRLLQPSTGEVRVRAITDGSQVAFRLQWADAAQDDLPTEARFCDACAVQLPAKIDPTVPAPQMGEPGRPVEITYWNAAWQATVDGRGDTIQDIHPRATVDHYPFDAQSLEKDPAAQRAMALRYAPARALGNMLAGPRETPVQDLIAEGPGTIAAASGRGSTGHGQRTEDGWAVVLTRKLPAGLSAQTGSQVAFAVWEGEMEEAGARKMRTGWINLALGSRP
jgi:DMSO reductase family type II enzyme heme b subunit